MLPAPSRAQYLTDERLSGPAAWGRGWPRSTRAGLWRGATILGRRLTPASMLRQMRCASATSSTRPSFYQYAPHIRRGAGLQRQYLEPQRPSRRRDEMLPAPGRA